jgi:hypothetical protein
LTQGPEGQEWLLDLQLSEDDGTTTLKFARAEADYFPAMAEHYRALFDGQRPG